MMAYLHFWWRSVFIAAGATVNDLASRRFLWLFLIEVVCAVVAFRAYRAPENKRWAVIRQHWRSEVRDVFLVIFLAGAAFFGYEWMENRPSQNRFSQVSGLLSNSSTLITHTPAMFPMGPNDFLSRDDNRPICIEVRLPQGFPGGRYQLPFKPVAPSPPALYDNGSAQRKGVDYTVSDTTIEVKYQPGSKDSLSVWYTTDDPFVRILPRDMEGSVQVSR